MTMPVSAVMMLAMGSTLTRVQGADNPLGGEPSDESGNCPSASLSFPQSVGGAPVQPSSDAADRTEDRPTHPSCPRNSRDERCHGRADAIVAVHEPSTHLVPDEMAIPERPKLHDPWVVLVAIRCRRHKAAGAAQTLLVRARLTLKGATAGSEALC